MFIDFLHGSCEFHWSTEGGIEYERTNACNKQMKTINVLLLYVCQVFGGRWEIGRMVTVGLGNQTDKNDGNTKKNIGVKWFNE